MYVIFNNRYNKTGCSLYFPSKASAHHYNIKTTNQTDFVFVRTFISSLINKIIAMRFIQFLGG